MSKFWLQGTLRWQVSSPGLYSSKSFCELVNANPEQPDAIWKLVWSSSAPPKVFAFAWKVFMVVFHVTWNSLSVESPLFRIYFARFVVPRRRCLVAMSAECLVNSEACLLFQASPWSSSSSLTTESDCSLVVERVHYIFKLLESESNSCAISRPCNAIADMLDN
ncbi:hypothetical protein V6N13_099668 [Hibiscus sabdariffa]